MARMKQFPISDVHAINLESFQVDTISDSTFCYDFVQVLPSKLSVSRIFFAVPSECLLSRALRRFFSPAK